MDLLSSYPTLFFLRSLSLISLPIFLHVRICNNSGRCHTLFWRPKGYSKTSLLCIWLLSLHFDFDCCVIESTHISFLNLFVYFKKFNLYCITSEIIAHFCPQLGAQSPHINSVVCVVLGAYVPCRKVLLRIVTCNIYFLLREFFHVAAHCIHTAVFISTRH